MRGNIVSDTIVRTRIEHANEPEVMPKPTGPDIASGKKELEDTIEPPFSDYELMKHKPYTVEYFNLGQFWEDKAGGFKPEIEQIEGYIADRVLQGKIDNTVNAVKEFYGRIEKLSGIDKTERPVIRIAKMAEIGRAHV
jgi:hypothetical protein